MPLDHLQLHNDALVIDSHNDTIEKLMLRGGRSIAGPDAPPRDHPESVIYYVRGRLYTPQHEIQSDLPKMRAGGLDAAYFTIDVTSAWGMHLRYALDAHCWFLAEVAAHQDQIVVARSAADLRAAKAAGKLAAVLAVENSEALDRSLYVLRALYEMGVRTMTLTHSARAWAADGEQESQTGGGLSRFGRDLVRAMNELDMLIDISHLSERGFWEVMDLTTAPVLASHSCCRALCDHGRNLRDEQIEAIAQAGGVVGLTIVPSFVDAERPTLEGYLDHIEHVAEVGGVEAAAIGTDFDGGGEVLEDASELPLVTEGLLERGWSEADVRKVLGENHLRLFGEVCG